MLYKKCINIDGTLQESKFKIVQSHLVIMNSLGPSILFVIAMNMLSSLAISNINSSKSKIEYNTPWEANVCLVTNN